MGCFLFEVVQTESRSKHCNKERGRELEKQGIKPLDALHLACAESGKIDYFLTCDDKVVKSYKSREMVVFNPVEFILKVTEEEKR